MDGLALWLYRAHFQGMGGMKLLVFVAAIALAGCTSTNTIQTSADTAIIQTRAAPVCGGSGAAKVAQKQAAIETINQGYDRYIIYGAASSSNVHASQMPGTYNTHGTIYGNSLNATTTYTPGPTIVSGRHKQAFAIKMFHEGDPGASKAIPARQILGSDWQEAVKKGSLGVCL